MHLHSSCILEARSIRGGRGGGQGLVHHLYMYFSQQTLFSLKFTYMYKKSNYIVP